MKNEMASVLRIASIGDTDAFFPFFLESPLYFLLIVWLAFCGIYSQLQIKGYKILRLFLKTFTSVPGVPGFS